MNNYTPTTEQVRATYLGGTLIEFREEGFGRFQRWLAEVERAAAEAAIEHVAALHVESDWKCGNPRHTNPEIGCPECYTECETCDRTYPCPTIVALDGAPEPEEKP